MRLLNTVHRRRLAPPSLSEQDALRELRTAFNMLTVPDSSASLPSEAAWLDNTRRLRELILTRDPRHFLRWDVIYRTMFVGYASYVRSELHYLKERSTWQTRWRPAIVEDPIGDPTPYLHRPSSSANLIHHAYHLAQFEDRVGLPVDEMDFVVEFGGGYGGMCRLVHRLGFRGKYVIFDLEAFSALQRFYLKSLGLSVLGVDDVSKAESGICCISDLAQLQNLCTEGSRASGALFIATWSLSEAPIQLRNSILEAVRGFDAYLIAYQDRFGEVDNLAAFEALQHSATGVAWQNVPFEPSPGNRYLMGLGRDRHVRRAEAATHSR
jgi:hypothetical protein